MRFNQQVAFIFFIGVFSIAQTLAQVPIASFVAPSTGCLKETLNISNTSSNSDQYMWDFCADDFTSLQEFVSVVPVTGISYGTGFKLVNDGGLWTGFALGNSSDKLFRLDFGDSPLNTPTVVDLGDPLDILGFPQSIELVKQNGAWFGFITNTNNGAGIILLSFGSSLTNIPTAQNLGGYGTTGRIWDTKVVKQGLDFILVFAERSSNNLVRVNFRDSFSNSTAGFVYTTTLAGPSAINGLDVVWTGSTWKVLVVSNGTNEIYQFDLGTNLLGLPVVDGSNSSIVNKPYRVDVLREADDYFLTVSGEAGDIQIFNYHDLNPANAPTALPSSTLNNMVGLDAIRFQGKSIIMGVGTTTSLERAVFELDCGASSMYSTGTTPTGINYTTAGAKSIELVATNSGSGESSWDAQTISVTTDEAPDISFATNGFVCSGSTVEFTASSTRGNIVSYIWDYGDVSGGSGVISQHSYSAGSYLARVDVTDLSGCKNFSQSPIDIFNPPQADFNLPAVTPFCSNQNYLFTNASSFDAGSNPIWQWSVNGTNVATTQDLSYLIPTTATQNIMLTASIPGCSTQTTQIISNVQDGPLVNFSSASSGCVNAVASFVNSSTGTITSYNWDFGDGNTSSQINATNAYSSSGNFAVTLTAYNVAGCQNFLTKNFPVYSNPQPDFAIEAPPFSCTNYPAQFDNNTPPLSDSNITTWAWSFGDAANGTSNQKNPTYTFSTAATYNVTLQATSNFGCSGTKQQSVLIYPSPQAAFTNTPACVNQNTQFTDASSGNIASYQWVIQGTILTGPNPPPYVFNSAGTFPVTLTTTSSNACKNQVVKNVTVPVPPVMDFVFQPPFAGRPTFFQELNPGGPDPSVAWNWNFGPGSGAGSPVSYSYATAGIYSVTLSATRNSGCIYSTSKNITIYEAPVGVPVASFVAPSTGCLKETLNISNTSSNSDQYMWDFCADDFTSLQEFVSVVPVTGISYGTGFKLVNDGGLWTGFALGNSSDKLFRLDFGDSPLNTPTVVDLGDPLDILGFPQSIELVKQNGAWFGFITNTNNGAGIILLSFGSSLTNIPTAQNLGGYGTTGRIWDTKVVKQGLDFILVFAERSSNNLVRVNFRDSFSNSTAGFVYTTTLAGPSAINGLDVVWTGSTWKVLVVSNGTNEIYQFDLGTNLLGLPVVDGSNSSIVNKPYRVDVLREADDYFLTVSGEAGDIQIFNYHDLNPANAPTALPSSTLNNMVGLDAIRFQGKSIIMGVGTTTSLERAVFELDCGASSMYSTGTTPTGINYTTAGAKSIELVATNSGSGESSWDAQTISVTTDEAPDISFATNGFVCSGSTVEFTASSTRGNIVSYIWDYGDVSGGSGVISQHSYSAGSYLARVDVTDLSGCKNFSQSPIDIFNPPQADFNLPAVTPFCSNQNYLFTNASSFDAGSNPIWQWSVNGTNVATTQDLSYLIPTTATQNIMLTASIPGCSTQTTQIISNVQDGPLVNFSSASSGCVNAVASFVNSSTGTITSYNWDFGDGNTSSQINATNAYSSSGNFAVTLTAYNVAGCQNFLTKNFPVYSNPQPDFAIEAPPFSCTNYPAQFDNNTPPLSDSNITTWAWSFGDAANGTSNQKNPTYTFSTAATYNVTLQATSNFGCSGTKQQSVLIYPSPQAAFTNTPACVNQNTQFTDASSGNIASYQWVIQGTILTGPNPPPYVFNSAGTFPVTLTTTSSNACKNQVVKNVTVPVPPVMDFVFQPPCAGKPTFFQELYPGGPDPSIAWNWNFGSGSRTGSPTNYTFAAAGGYTVTLSATRSSGCIYSTSKNITIYEGPEAKFTPSTQGGAAPLTVTFNNESKADAYFWQFGTNTATSNEVSPIYTYMELGEYKVLLTANDLHGCIDTVSTKIFVVIPQVDLAMNNFLLVEDPTSNASKPVVTVLNLGNIPLTNPEVQIDLGGNALLKEKIMSTILPGKSIQQTLNLEIVPQSLEYICAKVSPAGDVNIYNDKQCLSMTNNAVLFYPYPNPASGQLNFDWISSENENVVVTIYRSTGQIAFKQDFQMVQSGINQLAIDVSSLSSGLYLIQFSGAKAKKTFNVMVIN